MTRQLEQGAVGMANALANCPGFHWFHSASLLCLLRSGLSNLSSLSLRGCKKITNNGLEALQNSTSLTSLNLHGCKRISDKGLEALTKLPMKALSLGLTRVKDEGMQYLVRREAKS